MFGFLFAAVATVAAGPFVPPDPATVSIPDLAQDPSREFNPKKFYVFHRENATFAEAWHDLAVCLAFAGQPQFPKTPTHVEWKQQSVPKNASSQSADYVPSVAPGLGGVLGNVIVSLIDAPISAGIGRSLRQVNMSSCMLPRGYTRYVVSEQMWRQLNGKDIMNALAMQAKIASGPRPQTPVVP